MVAWNKRAMPIVKDMYKVDCGGDGSYRQAEEDTAEYCMYRRAAAESKPSGCP